MLISVLIPFRGNADLLAWSLDGYARQNLGEPVRAEVLVAADGCPLPPLPADTPAIAFSGEVLPRMGAAAARNRLIEKARGEILIFGNADCRPDPDFVATHARRLVSLPPKSMVLGHSPWEVPESPTVFDALLAHTPMIFFYDRLRPGESYDFRHAWTLNLSVRRDDARQAGGFHDLLRPVYYEDLAFAHRVMGASARNVFYEPAARVLHRHPTSWEQYLDREELLGLMTPVLARVAPDVFAALHGDVTLEQMTQDYHTFVRLDAPMHAWIHKRMQAWVREPESSLGQGPARQRLLETIYQMHVPLKRLAFRLGFLRGLELADDAHWERRIPQSLWKQAIG